MLPESRQVMHELKWNPRVARRARSSGAVALAAALTLAFAGTAARSQTPSSRAPGWRVAVAEQVDLWLHGFALLTSDTGHVPFFERGYTQQIKALKAQKNVYTLLDANRQELAQRFAANPALTNAQFLAMYFPSFQEIVTATDHFIRSGGDPRAASDPQMQQEIALLAQNFPSPADRNWLRLFVQSLQDESTRFYHAYWTSEQQARSAAFTQVNQLWLGTFYPKLSRFLNNTQQSAGQLVLSLPLGGEGRTVNGGKQDNMIAVDFPKTAEAAANAIFGFVHEAVAQLVAEAITDNTTPAEQRSGATVGYQGNGSVRGGALLIKRVQPDQLQAYMRFYLQTAGLTPPSGDATSAFEAAFPTPNAILTAVGKQIDVVLGGI
jgi:hypothetical protein